MSTKPNAANLCMLAYKPNELLTVNRRYAFCRTRIPMELGYTKLPIDIFIRNPESSSHKMAGI